MSQPQNISPKELQILIDDVQTLSKDQFEETIRPLLFHRANNLYPGKEELVIGLVSYILRKPRTYIAELLHANDPIFKTSIEKVVHELVAKQKVSRISRPLRERMEGLEKAVERSVQVHGETRVWLEELRRRRDEKEEEPN